MQIKLGEKIKELRKRDGRKQEELALALGVTNQAVSRWEANGGYPDMELIPAIANFFHITIDELFGYDNDRNVKLKAYYDEADRLSYEEKNFTACITLLRGAIAEFPSESQLKLRLAWSLKAQGYQEYGEPTIKTDDCDYTVYDTAHNAHNEYWKEAVALLEDYLKSESDSVWRESAILALIELYKKTGNFENAERTALAQSSLKVCKEVLLAHGSDGEKADRYRGETILALANELKNVISESVIFNNSLAYSKVGLEKLLAVTRLYESIFDDGNCGQFHSDLCMLYLSCSITAAHTGDYESNVKYFDAAFEHYTEFYRLMNSSETFHYTAPLVAKVRNVNAGVVLLTRDMFEVSIKDLPAEFADAIRNDPKYSEIFTK